MSYGLNTTLVRTRSGLNTEGDFRSAICAFVQGRMYNRWVDSVSGSARDNGYNEDDLIEDGPGIVESIFRDELFVERDLNITTFTDTTHVRASTLRFAVDDYYNYAIYHNVTRNFKTYVSDFTGATKEMVLAAADTLGEVGDFIYLTNIQGDTKINYASFDIVGNTTDGLRKDWKFARSIYKEVPAMSLISSLLYEARCLLITSHNQYKLIAIEEDSSPDTWTNPLKIQGSESVICGLTSVRALYNDYIINYHYDYASQEYKKKLFVNKNGFTSTLTNGAVDEAICKTIYDNYSGIINKYEYSCDWIYDDATAELFFDKIFAWYSKQRMVVNWAGDIGNYITYEVGDQVILNYANMIPTGINNTSKFMIMGNPIQIVPGSPFINFSLIEVT